MLHALSRLVGLDKHQSILALAAHQGGISLDGFKVSGGLGKTHRIQASAHVRLTPDQPTATILKADPGAKISLAGPCQIYVKFGFADTDLQPYAGAIDLLHAMGALCEKIVETIAVASGSGELA